MITPRDKLIFKFIEEFGGITINQCANMFFNNSTKPYDVARKRLRKLYDMKCFKYFNNLVTSERVYYFNKKLTPHAVFLLDVYAKFISKGATILEFKKEDRWLDGKVRVDGFITYEYNSLKRIACIEIDVFHETNMDKYDILYQSNEIQNVYNGVFPLIIVVGDDTREHINENYDSVFLNYRLDDFTEKVLVV